jgi:dGTPase
VQEVRQHGRTLIGFSEEMKAQSLVLKQFLFRQLYRHPQVMQTMNSAQQVVKELFAAYMVEPERMKPRFVQRAHIATTLHERARGGRLYCGYDGSLCGARA